MTRLITLTRGALVGLALFGAACQGELKLLNGANNPNGQTGGGDMAVTMPPPDNTISFANIEQDMETLGCTGPVTACHGGNTPAGLMKLQNNVVSNMAGLMANYMQVDTDMPGHQRVNHADPLNSLILLKPLGTSNVTHTGGKNFATTNDPNYKRWLQWIVCGAKFDSVMISTCPAVPTGGGDMGGGADMGGGGGDMAKGASDMGGK